MRIVLIFVFASVLVGCSREISREATPANPEASTAASRTGRADESAGSSDAIVIDVRSQSEWNSGHIEQAIHIPHTEIADRIGEVTDDQGAKIIVYCAAGGRAGKAKVQLEELGFTNVENAGGYDDFKQRQE